LTVIIPTEKKSVIKQMSKKPLEKGPSYSQSCGQCG